MHAKLNHVMEKRVVRDRLEHALRLAGLQWCDYGAGTLPSSEDKQKPKFYPEVKTGDRKQDHVRAAALAGC